jgi:sodium transport system permease protein
MLSQPLVIARKELTDHARDTRSVASTALYALMGPAVILLAVIARAPAAGGSAQAQPWVSDSALITMLPIMAAVFALMAVFTAAMPPAMDTIAGERERRTLLPLIVSAVSRRHVIVGKWIAASVFAAGGLVVNLLAFEAVFAMSAVPSGMLAFLVIAPALLALACLVAALELAVSTLCRSTKEANTYLSILMFSAMGLAMWLAFRSQQSDPVWWRFLPLVGHQHLLQSAFAGGPSSLVQLVLIILESWLLAAVSLATTALVLAATWVRFERDEALYGG